MKAGKVRPLALCIFKHAGKVLLSKGHDRVKNETFYRAIGGGIEFGERAQDAVAREVMEEISAEIKNIKQLAVTENIFTFDGRDGHEIVFTFEAEFVDPKFYSLNEIPIIEQGEVSGHATWVDIGELRTSGIAVYPQGTIGLI